MITFSVYLEAEAENDLRESFLYFALTNEKLAEDFLKEFKNLSVRISEFPELFSVRYKNVRIGRISRFKTLLLFITDLEKREIKILRILREERDWKGLLNV